MIEEKDEVMENLHKLLRGSIEEGEFEAALACLDTMIRFTPYDSKPHIMRSEVLTQLERFDEAITSIQTALSLSPSSSRALGVAANCYLSVGDVLSAKMAIDRSLTIAPEQPRMKWQRSFCSLSMFDFKSGFEEYEYGFCASSRTPRGPLNKRWNGEPTPVLFVHGEQGLGDQIQFIRFLEEAKARSGGMLVLETQAELIGLCKHCADLVVAMQPDGSIPVAYTKWISLLSIPNILGVDKVFGNAYFTPPEVEVDLAGAKVGFVYSGNPKYPNDKGRSLTLEEARQFEGFAPFGLLQNAGEIPFEMPRIAGADIGHTAAVISKLDLVVTVDTSIVHLCGALGKEAWLIAPKNGEWRWGLSGSKSPWYDSVEVFRCVDQDRQPAIKAICDRLKARYGKSDFLPANIKRPLAKAIEEAPETQQQEEPEMQAA